MDAVAAEGKLPLGLDANGDMTRKSVIAAFILGTLAVFTLFPIGILAIVLSNMGMERVKTDLPRARKLVAWSWGIFAVTDVVVVIGLITLLALS
ncbi:hypothetical protein [Actinocorallia longicatena]|uniref:DUF4190 domain-containing protein n=1 Tax=Actinocorallia longicatena TaxID=111803 RepID=A0ABP6QNP5_9ACTN